jgi:D-alanyl-D-alanine carboxypeptidase/D-alanyl-D-alanine-endopeptidase (penicillin-binding protein 4)
MIGRRPPGSRRLVAAIAATAMLAGCGDPLHTPAVSPATLGRDAPRANLKQKLDALLETRELAGATWGLEVRSLAGGEPLYSLNAGKLLLPGSNMKIVTLAAAAARLGWDYSYPTSLVAAGPIADGALEGDLVVVGRGDPTIDDWDGGASALFATWAETLKGRGIRAIRGRIVGDDNAFEDDALGPGWAWDDLDRSFAAGVGALQFNQNSAQITMTPGTLPGEAVNVSTRPSTISLRIMNALVTGPAGVPASWSSRRRAGVLELRGTVPAGASPLVRTVAVENPTLYFVGALRDALVQNGIQVDGEAVDIDDLPDEGAALAGMEIVTHQSLPLSAMAATMMKLSQNLYAETLLKTIGGGAPPAAARLGREAESATLRDWGLTESDVVIADGSGLSPYNLATPHALVAVLSRVSDDPALRGPFVAALPVAGIDGSLSLRMRGTPAQGNARAKTGTLANARALSGYVTSAGGEALVFSVIANNFGGAADTVEQAIDAIAVALAEHR